MRTMKRETPNKNGAKLQKNPRVGVVEKLLVHAEFIRRKGSTEEGAEAAELEAMLKDRLAKLKAA